MTNAVRPLRENALSVVLGLLMGVKRQLPETKRGVNRIVNVPEALRAEVCTVRARRSATNWLLYKRRSGA